MQPIEVEMLTPETNYVVLKMPDRAFPGVVFQGDSLHILVEDVRELQNLLADRNMAEARDAANTLAEKLTNIRGVYEAAMAEHSLDLPYAR